MPRPVTRQDPLGCTSAEQLVNGIKALDDRRRTHTRYGAAMQYTEPVLHGLVAGRRRVGKTDGVFLLNGEFEAHGAGAGGGHTELEAGLGLVMGMESKGVGWVG